MIHIIDRQTEQILDVLVNQSDSKIYWDTKMTEAIEDNVLIFEFRMLADSPAAKHIVPKNKLTAQDQDGFHRLFVIDTVEMSHDANGKVLFVSALGDHIELANDEPISPQTLPGQTAETAVQFVLANTRYQPGQIDFSGSRTITFDTYTNPLAALQKIASEFELELRFRVNVNPDGTITRIVDLLKPDEVFDGKEIVFGKDMTGIRRKENTENICTRLVGIGPADEDGNIVTFASVNGGKIYVEDEEAYQRWNNAGRHIWGIFEYQPEEGTEVTPQQLLDATKKEMEKRKNSAVEWEVQAAALEQVIGLEHERVRVGMNVRIKDEAFDPPIYLEARVLETEMPELDDPNGNFSYTFGNYREVKVVVPAEVKAIQKILFHNSGGWSAAKVRADIAQQMANEAKADVEAANARIDNLIAVDITALHAEIENLEAIKANVEDLFSINAQIENLRAEKANITDLEVTNARIDSLVANDLTAINAEITNLKAGKANITDLNATNARVGALEADVGSINTLLAGNLGAENFRAGAIYAGSGVIAQGAIGDAEISNLNASKINAGILNTALVTIQGANGRLKMSGNRLQVFANKSDGSLYERVSLGDVNGDGSVYGLRVRGADGQTVLLDENGVKREGITDGSITNEKIADDANISGTKLDIASVVTQINNGTTTIQSSKIFLDGKTLDIQFGTLRETVNSQGQTIENHETRITLTEEGLTTKVSVSQYQQDQAALSSQLSQMSTRIQQQANQIALKADAANVYTKSQIDGQFTAVNTQISNLSAQLTLQADQIATKVSRTEFESLQIGGRNLLRNTGVQFDWSVDSFGGNYYKQHNIVLFDDYKSLRGKTITLSFWAKTESLVYGTTNPWFGFEFRLNFADGTNLFISLGSKTVPEGTNDWKKYSITREIPDKEILSASGYLVLFRDATGNVSLKNIKLELGNKATDWTPAPEDVQGQIDGLGSRMTTAETSITQLSNQIQLKANQTTVDTLANRISSAESTINLLSDEIDLKVDKDGVIAAINVSPETIKLSANKINLDGFVEAKHIKSLNGLNINDQFVVDSQGNVNFAGNLEGATGVFTGSLIAQDPSDNSGHPSKTEITYDTFSRQVHYAEDEYWTSVLIGSRISMNKYDYSGLFGPKPNAYLSGNFSISEEGIYFSVRSASPSGWYSVTIDLDGIHYSDPNDVVFKEILFRDTDIAFNTNVSVTGSIIASNGWFDGQIFELSNASLLNIYIRPRSGGSVRFTAAGTTTSFVPIYTSNVFTTSVDINTGGTHLYARPSSSGNLKVTAAGTVDVWRPVEAASFQNRSLERYKQDIELWNGSALDIIRNSEIYQYRSKTDVQNGIDKLKYGFIIGEGYQTPNEVITPSGESVDIYVQSSVAWKAIQELDSEQMKMKDEIEWLKLENQYLKQKIQQLEGMIS